METLVVEVVENRAFVLPPVLGEEEGQVLLPGENDVRVTAWTEAKKNKGVQVALSGSVLRAKKGTAKPLVGPAWDKITIAKAAEMLTTIDDIVKLNEIKRSTKKKQLKQLCAARISELLEE